VKDGSGLTALPECGKVSGVAPIVWLTGLSGAGKSTIAEGLLELMRDSSIKCEMLDGDVIRRELCRDLGFSQRDRVENMRRIGFVASLLSRHGIVVVIAVIAPYRDAREALRSSLPHLIEVYVDAPLDVCEERDPKGLYRKARAGDLAFFTGIDAPYEHPIAPHIHCRTNVEKPHESIQKVADYLFRRLAAFRPT